MITYGVKFLGQWYLYLRSVKDDWARAELTGAIFDYGARCKEPTTLPPQMIEYFNAVVRPELDRQHREQDRQRARERTQQRKAIKDTFTLLGGPRKGGRSNDKTQEC